MSHFKLIKKLNNGVRIGELKTPHGVIKTPFFMPVGTVGSVKGVAPWELEELGAEIVLSNTYHLYLRPGEQLVKKLGGLHQFMGWNKPILTDSGGYQVFSLGKNNAQNSNNKFPNSNTRAETLVKITEDGVEFKSHLDGSKHFFTPEKVIQIQLDLGVDILMPLDVCPSGKASHDEVKRATELTIKWAERAKRYFDSQIAGQKCQNPNNKSQTKSQTLMSKDQNKNLTSDIGNLLFSSDVQHPILHGIVQGGLDLELRKECAKALMDMDFDGYSVGGLAVDLETRDMWNIVKLMGEILPENKQRYLMGVGTPNDIITATQLGMDMFDCVLPTRLARHGNIYVKSQKPVASEVEPSNLKINEEYTSINLLNSQYREDPETIDPTCGCPACSFSPPRVGGVRGGANKNGFSKAYISHLLRSKEILGLRLATLHNLWQYLNLMRELKED